MVVQLTETFHVTVLLGYLLYGSKLMQNNINN